MKKIGNKMEILAKALTRKEHTDAIDADWVELGATIEEFIPANND
jgi:hypothetical protein